MANPGPAGAPASSPSQISENVTLRIVVLAHGNRSDNDLYLVLGLNTTIAQLKQRIQESLAQHPPPELQRLIYHGRPLLDGNATLAQILRIDPRGGNPSHVFHLVIRDSAEPSGPPATQPRQSTAAPAQPPTQSAQHMPPQVAANLVPGLREQAEHMRIHSQLHNIQHQIQHAQALNRANQARLQAQQAIVQSFQNHPMHNSDPSTAGHPHHPPQNSAPLPPNQPVPHHTAQTQNLPAAQITRVEERIGPNGERIRTTTSNNGTSSMTFRLTGLNVPNPLDRPSSAPGSSPLASSDLASRDTNVLPPNIQIHPHPSHPPAGFPFPPGMQLPIPLPTNHLQQLLNTFNVASSNTSSTDTMAWLLSSPHGPQAIVFAPSHGLFATQQHNSQLPESSMHGVQQNPPDPTTATLSNTSHEPSTANRAGGGELQAPTPTPTTAIQAGQRPPPPQPGPRPQLPEPARQAVNAPVPARQPQAVGNRNQDNEMLQFVINRGWLFLRVYMFIFVLSESGTWRRIFMLGFAIIFCLLPRNNPFTELLQAVRRHFETFIGPPALPPRQRQQRQDQASQQANNDRQTQRGAAAVSQAQGTSQSRRSQPTMPTPEEAARRLLEQQNRRNPNPILNALQQLEQGIVLFMASLVPGLGERHIQAREEARRILDEEERRVREESERSEFEQRQDTASNTTNNASNSDTKDDGPLPSNWATSSDNQDEHGQARSSGISANSRSDQDVRSRTTHPPGE